MPPGAADAVPADTDLPGPGWVAVDEGFAGNHDSVGPADLIDCTGPDFPEQAVAASATSPHFVRSPRSLVHGIGVEFLTADDARLAAQILAGSRFAGCLGRSVAADLEGRPADIELLGIDVEATHDGHRVRFTGGDEGGVRPVHLDVVAVHGGRVAGLLWFGDTPEPFPDDERVHVVSAVRSRLVG